MNMTYQRNVSFYHGKGRCALSFIFNLYFDSFYQIYFLTAIYICDNQFNSIQSINYSPIFFLYSYRNVSQ